jgi:hypothetical protein
MCVYEDGENTEAGGVLCVCMCVCVCARVYVCVYGGHTEAAGNNFSKLLSWSLCPNFKLKK